MLLWKVSRTFFLRPVIRNYGQTNTVHWHRQIDFNSFRQEVKRLIAPKTVDREIAAVEREDCVHIVPLSEIDERCVRDLWLEPFVLSQKRHHPGDRFFADGQNGDYPCID